MPNRRTAERLTLLFAACAAAAALAAVPQQTSRACPISPPSPLRLLYEKSDLVAVVLAGDTAPAAADRAQGVADNDQKQEGAYEVGLVKTTLQVEKTLKGDGGERAVSLYHYQGGDEVDEEYAGGTKLLVFLTRRGATGYTPTDYRYAIKKLSEDGLKVYLRRIEELSAIESREKPDPAEITEWLVRCAEEPATRWEGGYGPSEPCADDDCRKEAEQRRVAGVEARTQRSSKVYQFVAMAQPPPKPAAKPR